MYINIIKDRTQIQALVFFTTFVIVEPREPLLKAQFPNLYSRKLHLDCYWFCLKGKDYFDTIRTTGNNGILFAVFFFQDKISICWT